MYILSEFPGLMIKYLKNIAFAGLLVFAVSCSTYDNFTTYFNTFYNMNRLMKQSEDEFEFQTQNLLVNPRVIVPQPDIYKANQFSSGPPPFLQEFIVNQTKRQPVSVKLDSIIIKGSKILAYKSKTDYVEGALWLMAKTYFYKEEWRPSQIKCSELIDLYPEGDLSPDAHLLASKTLLIQRDFFYGKTMLSRTVDIAWQKKRLDILSEAFRLQAELSLYENDLDGALRPYKQAVVQSDDPEIKAKWQMDMAALFFRLGKFDRAEAEFKKVRDYSPDYLTEYESYLYEASSKLRQQKFEEAAEILEMLETDGKYTEWLGYTYAVRMQIPRLKNEEKEIMAGEVFADTAYVNNPLVTTYNFERGMDYYKEKQYLKAVQYFAKSRTQRTPVFTTSMSLFKYLTELDQKKNAAKSALKQLENDSTANDTVRYFAASYLFEAGRIHEELGNADSARLLFEKAYVTAPRSDYRSARFFHAYARIIEADQKLLSDSIFEQIVLDYPYTDYGKDAIARLNFTEAFVIDTVMDYFASGMSFRKTGNYDQAAQKFYKVFERFPDHKLAPRSLYNIGWMYEKDVKLPDSAMKYYDLLLQFYPASEYAADVRLPYAYLKAVKAGGDIPDSLKYTARAVTAAPDENLLKKANEEYEQKMKENMPENNVKKDDNKNFFEKTLGAPTELFNQSKDMFKQLDPSQIKPGALFPSSSPDSAKVQEIRKPAEIKPAE